MDLTTDNLLLELTTNRPLPLLKARGIRVHCVEGVVWMTVAGVPGDFVLRAGESYCIPGKGLVLIEALPSARVHLEAPVVQSRAWWRMVWTKIDGKAGSLMDIDLQALAA